MIQELSTKNFILVLRDQSKFFLDEKEANIARMSLKKGDKWIEIGNDLINTFEVVKIVSGINYQEGERYKRGDYKCPSCGEWIPKFKVCGRCL